MRSNYLPCAEVTVQIDGQPLQEYDTDPSDPDVAKTVAAYIEIRPRAEFSIDLTFRPDIPYREGAMRLIDGAVEASPSGPVLRPFVFAELNTTDAAAKPEMFETLRELGEIKVRVQRCVTTTKQDQRTSRASLLSAAAADVPEKALKGRAVTNHATLGAPKPTTPHWVETTFPWGDEALAVFVFKYRTRQGLQAEGIISRTPTPVPLEERNAASLTQAELVEVVNRLQAEKEVALKIKKEGQRSKRARSETLIASTPGVEDDDVTIASENSGRKKAKVAETFIDICDSDDDEED
ncbi:hypothetical protein B0A48_05214 [Cryoendolithus antarcticus]|uniref:DUF7918 domain-containing protein n=1 Tax=Cryoendolithus antarcticus TaxID=1507870 RepID=A0A1V8THV1_9PEZI|nr:hypothetical protein B0A48_05214 [Cryoendolithus antarcticus]